MANLLKTYPALSAALVNIGVIVASYFGLHVTGDQLMWIVGLVSALLGVAVHSNVTPLAKLEPLSELGKIVEATDTYLNEHGGYPPSGSHASGNATVHEMLPPPPPPVQTDYNVIGNLEGGK